MSDLTERLWASDAASALTNEAARALEKIEAERDEAREWEAKYKGDLEVLCDWNEEANTRYKDMISKVVMVVERLADAADDLGTAANSSMADDAIADARKLLGNIGNPNGL